MLERAQDDLIATANTTAKVTSALQAIYTIYEKVTGLQYSSADITILDTLKQTYEEILGKSSPTQWELDEHGRPTHRVKYRNWSRYCNELSAKNNGIALYYHQSKVIAKVIGKYLSTRGNRSFGSGTSGDVLEQYLCDWIHFALYELPTMNADEASIQKIQIRLRYLQTVDTHEALFKYGTFKRSTNKFDVFDDIEEQLEIALKRAKIEKSRISAREQFEKCKINISSLLADCADVIFHARGTDVSSMPFDLARFVDQNRERPRETDEAYAKLRETHTGKILYDVITHAGTHSFGAGSTEILPRRSEYYDRDYRCTEFNINLYQDDPFPWITDETTKRSQLLLIQKMGQSMLRIAGLKELLESAYDLTGDCGNLWAYGDREGKNSLTGLLFFIDQEIDTLKSHFEDFHEHNRNARKLYSRMNRVDADKGANPNFNEIDILSGRIADKLKLLKTDIGAIRVQMHEFPGDALDQINKKKRMFYESFNHYIIRFRPEHFDTYGITNLTQETAHVQTEEKYDDNRFYTEEEETPFYAYQLPIETSLLNEKYFYLNKPEFTAYLYQHPTDDRIEDRQNQWRLGDSYDDWMKGYFTRHQSEYLRYVELAQKFHRITQSTASESELQDASLALENQLHRLQTQLKNERPEWRFKFGLWPFKTKGWPFNQEANAFANLLTQELTLLQQEIAQAHDTALHEVQNTQSNAFTSDHLTSAEVHQVEHSCQPLHTINEEEANDYYSLLENSITSQAKINLLLQESQAANKLAETVLENPENSDKDDERYASQIASKTEINLPEEDPEYSSESVSDYFNNWHRQISETLQESYQNQYRTPFIVFYKPHEVDHALKTLLDIKDQADPEIAEMIATSCCSLKMTLTAAIFQYKKLHDGDSKDQLELLSQLLTVITTRPIDRERTEATERLTDQTEKAFAAARVRNNIRGLDQPKPEHRKYTRYNA